MTEVRKTLIVAPNDVAAAAVLGGYDITTWNGTGPAGYDWSSLAGRKVDIWLAADTDGQTLSAELAEKLLPIAASVRLASCAPSCRARRRSCCTSTGA